jgi:hypothetical protein
MTNANGVNSSPAACCAWFRPADRSPDDRQVLSKDPPDTKALPWAPPISTEVLSRLIALIASNKELSLGSSVADTRAGWRWDARISLIPRSRILRRTKTEFLGRLPSFCAAGVCRGYASLLVKEAHAFLVPKITASEHCSHCSTPARTMCSRRLYQIVDGKAGPAPPHYPDGTPGPASD